MYDDCEVWITYREDFVVDISYYITPSKTYRVQHLIYPVGKYEWRK